MKTEILPTQKHLGQQWSVDDPESASGSAGTQGAGTAGSASCNGNALTGRAVSEKLAHIISSRFGRIPPPHPHSLNEHRFPRIAFALLLSCFAASAADGKTPDHTAIVMVSGELPALEEDVYMFSSRSGYSASALFSVGVKKRPDPHKEYILCHSSVAWSGGGLGLEEIYDENGEVNEWSIRVTADRAAQWGTEHAVEAKVFFYETLEKPPPGEAHSHGLLAEASDSVTVVAPEVKIKSISFNHTPGTSASDGIDLRESYAGPDIVAPEWTSGGNAKPVAYRAGVSPVFIVDFELLPKCLKNLKVRAREPRGNFSFVGGTETVVTTPEDALLWGLSSVPRKVDRGTLVWTWSAVAFNGINVKGWEKFKTVSVPCFLLLDAPTMPWREGGEDQVPWCSALKFVIGECGIKGEADESIIMKKLTRNLNHGYRSTGTAPRCVVKNSKGNYVFDYEAYINPPKNDGDNCEDAGRGLAYSARLIGIDAQLCCEKYLYDPEHHYYVKAGGLVYDTGFQLLGITERELEMKSAEEWKSNYPNLIRLPRQKLIPMEIPLGK